MKVKKISIATAAVMAIGSIGAMEGATYVSAVEKVPDGVYLIRNVNSQLALTAESDGNVVQRSAREGSSANLWKVTELSDSYYSIVLADGGKALETSTAADANVGVAAADNKDAQQYLFKANEDGSFKIATKISNGAKGVEIANGSAEDGANVREWEINGYNCQDWELVPVVSRASDTATANKKSSTGYEGILGDLNGDNKVNIIDLALLKINVADGKYDAAGDVTADDTNTAPDAAALTKFILTGKGDFKRKAGEVSWVYQAIDGEYSEGVSETTNEGYTSTAYLNMDNKSGTETSYGIEASEAGVYSLTFRYANGGTAARDFTVKVGNGLYYYTVSAESTGAWTAWQEVTVNVYLNAGVNALVLESITADGAPNLDTLTVKNTSDPESDKTAIPPIKGEPVKPNKGEEGVGYQMEDLDRGVSAAYTGTGVLVSWRTLATDSENTTFKLYKNGEFVADIGAADATNYFVSGATATDTFTIDTYVSGVMTEFAQAATLFSNKNSGQSGSYFDINMTAPADQTMPDGSTCSYTVNDCSVGDADGDGQYELYVKWDPSNSQDNSKNGYTGTVFIDCYKLDGTRLFRIDLGKNIRAGAHYTQFLVYDYDGDGMAELMCKTADGTTDGKGKVIGDASADYRTDAGRILSGPEYLTLFDGKTGEALDTVDYYPARGTVSAWGDSYGNRVDRFTACTAYLNGTTPSAVFGRGYYTRMTAAAYDVVDKKIVTRWQYDTGNSTATKGYGDGNHHILAADVDSDGKDEVVLGSAVIDDNGKLLYTTGLAHGDAIHIGDFDPSSPGLEIFQCLEDEKHPNGTAVNYGTILRRASDGYVLFREEAGGDTGRCLADNLIGGNEGAEMVGSHNSVIYSCTGNHAKVADWSDITKWGQNSVVYWTDTLERAALDRTMVDQYGKGRVFTGDGVTYNNATKSNACLTCDLMGDWREEMIFRLSEGTGVRVFTTTYQTEYKIPTFMQNPQYRTQVSAQNNGYNQPPHTDFFLGTGVAIPEAHTVYVK